MHQTIVAFVLLVGVMLCLVLIVRSFQVLVYGFRLLDEIQTAALHDVVDDKPWRWRLVVFWSVHPFEMILKFWKPLDNFYPDKSFLK